jgi:hypothetical protein
MRRTAALLLLALAALTACSAQPLTTSATQTSATIAASAAPAGDNALGSATAPLPWGKQVSGDTYAITIGTPAPYSPSASAANMSKAPRAVAMQVTVVNNQKDKALPAMAINIQATAGNAQSEQIFDSANDVGGPTADILPGKSLTWKVAFGVPTGQTDLTVQVSYLGVGATVYYGGKV